MDAIRELQKQLQQAQQTSNVKRISERNCVDLVLKLIETEQVKLLHTTSGKEYVTPERLDKELGEALAAAGGRLSVAELPHELGIDAGHVEQRVELLCARDSSLTRVHGELLSAECVRDMALEIEESLGQSGCVAVSDLAVRYDVPAEFIRESVVALLHGSIAVKQSVIYTTMHATRVEAQVRGLLRGCTRPVTTADLVTRHRVDPEMFMEAAQKMIKDGTIAGTLQGGVFIPKIHADAQMGKFDHFFSANHFVTLASAKSNGINLKDWAVNKGIDGMTLRTVFLAPQLVDPVLASVVEACASEGWADARTELPEAATDDDACELLLQLGVAKRLPAEAVVLEWAVMSRGFLQQVAATFETEIKTVAERATAPGGSKRAPLVEDDDDSGAKKRGKRGAKPKRCKADGDGEDEVCASASGIESQVLIDGVLERYPEVPVDLHAELEEQLQPLLVAAVAEAQSALRSSLQGRGQVEFEKAEKLVKERYERVVLGQRALEALNLQDTPLLTHHQRELVAEPLHRLIAVRIEEATGTTVEVTAANRKEILDKIVAKQGAAKAASLAALLAVLSGKAVSKGGAAVAVDLGELYRAAADDCHMFCRRVDKKAEKDAVRRLKAERREQLRATAATDSLGCLALGLHVALLLDGVPGLHFPEELWSLRLVASRVADGAVRAEAEKLCNGIEKGGDAVALEEAAGAWRLRMLGGK